jgi:hypothetical protein
MQKYILSKNDVIGKVEEYVIWYELQHHGFVHAHVILWVKKKMLKALEKKLLHLYLQY